MATKSQGRGQSYSARAGNLFGRARQEATPSRLIAAGALAAGAAAYAVLRDPARRERIRESARDYLDRGTAWWQGSDSSRAPSAVGIPVS